MKLSRRQFFGLAGAAGLAAASGCQRIGESVGLTEEVWERVTPDLDGPEGPPSFATINDTHVVDSRSASLLGQAVRRINEDPTIRFTVVLGDIANDGRYEEMQLAKRTLDRLERPYFCVPGNHDVDPRLDAPYTHYEQAFDERNWEEDDEGWAFVGLDTCQGTASEVVVPPDRIAWLEKTLGRISANRPLALFTHHPFNPNTERYRVGNADEVLALFAGHNLRLVASGHYHGNQVEERDGVLFTTTGCCSTTRDNMDGTAEKGFRIYRMAPDSLQHEFIPLIT